MKKGSKKENEEEKRKNLTLTLSASLVSFSYQLSKYAAGISEFKNPMRHHTFTSSNIRFKAQLGLWWCVSVGAVGIRK